MCCTYIGKLHLTSKAWFIWFDLLFCCGHILNICATFHIWGGVGGGIDAIPLNISRKFSEQTNELNVTSPKKADIGVIK